MNITKGMTVAEMLVLVKNAVSLNRNTVQGSLPDRAELVSLLAAKGVKTQTVKNRVVNDSDWRNEDFDTAGPCDSLYVWAKDHKDARCADVAVVFDYANNEMSYC